ncbi:hypothetical protein C0993_005719 [Termitomyces sp. T159_Od127]|nr:hypothetical protein C0993_005719 [Termitomyces sp. T159_Od127]
MFMDDISNVHKSVFVSAPTVSYGAYEVVAPGEVKDRIQVPDDLDHLKATKYDNQVLESVVQGASQENCRVARIQGLFRWSCRLKRVIGTLKKKKQALSAVRTENAKPRCRGFYTFLYGGRVNGDTFYDYKDQL